MEATVNAKYSRLQSWVRAGFSGARAKTGVYLYSALAYPDLAYPDPRLSELQINEIRSFLGCIKWSCYASPLKMYCFTYPNYSLI